MIGAYSSKAKPAVEAAVFSMSFCIILLLTATAIGQDSRGQAAPKRDVVEKEVSFKTEDGWVIRGVLSLPQAVAGGEKIAGVVMVPSPHHDRDIYGHNGYPSPRAILESKNIATLRIDIRGRGGSSEPREYRDLDEAERAKVAMDVRGAIDYLSKQGEVDGRRIGVVTEGESAEAALEASLRDRRVCGLVLLSGRVREASREAIASRPDLPILCVVSKEDKASLGDMVDIYRTSGNSSSDLMVHSDIGLGNAMFIMWAAKFPDQKPLEATVTEWLIERLQPSNQQQEVSFKSEDGWTLYGSFRPPKRGVNVKAPGVVFVHSNLSDRYVFDELERLLADSGFVTLNFDFRGRGKSRGKGSHFDLSQAERDKGYLDVKAALDFLGSQQSVDPNRLAVIATSVGVRYGIKAANLDPRVKTFVMLGGLPERADVEKTRFPVLFISSLGIRQISDAFREFYGLTKDRGSRLLEYRVGGVGYHLFELDEGLQPSIIQWMKMQFALP